MSAINRGCSLYVEARRALWLAVSSLIAPLFEAVGETVKRQRVGAIRLGPPSLR